MLCLWKEQQSHTEPVKIIQAKGVPTKGRKQNRTHIDQDEEEGGCIEVKDSLGRPMLTFP